MEDMDEKLQEGVTETGEQPQWNPFPVSAETFYNISRDYAVLRFGSPDAFGQCVEALRGAAGRTLGPYTDDFMGLMDRLAAGQRSIDRYEAEHGPRYTEDGAPCAACLAMGDMTRLAMYLVDMVLLLDAGAAFEGGNVEGGNGNG